MRYYRLRRDGVRLAVRTDGEVYDLTSANPALNSFRSLVRAASIADADVDDIARRHVDAADSIGMDALSDAARPLVPEEVWAAGVTYEISEKAREEESSMPEIYLDVYDADRPELFFKATPSRTVGPGEAIGIRADSDWDVPEPELGLVLYRGDVVGYTVGNDVSSRDIEGENPLYLPQAKVYDRCCALGPCVATGVDDPTDLEMRMDIRRDGETVFEGHTSTAEMVRSPTELVDALARHDTVPEFGVLLTGTSIVPEDSFTLHPDDRVRISVEQVGTLGNPVTTV